MLLILFRRSYCRVPTSTPKKPVATAGWAYGQWYKRSYSFVFRLVPGVCKASATFTGTNGTHEFQFRSGFCQAVHIPWENVDYDYNHNYYLLARERDRLGLRDFRVSDCPFQRRPSITDFYNPTHLAYLVQGAVTHGRRRYDLEEYLSPDNRYYCPSCVTSTSPSHPMHRTWRGRFPSRSRSGSPQPRHPPSPRCLHPQAHHHLSTPLQWGIDCPPPIKEVLPWSDQRQGICHQSLLQIPLSGNKI